VYPRTTAAVVEVDFGGPIGWSPCFETFEGLKIGIGYKVVDQILEAIVRGLELVIGLFVFVTDLGSALGPM